MDVQTISLDLVTAGLGSQGRFFWQNTPDKYVVFIAEFFLRRSNRTTVARFLPEFLSEFPDFDGLAEADPEAVVERARWAGLASRVRRLPEISKSVSSEPTWTAEKLLKLPYIGTYAAEGIALYAYDEPHFPIDNNVRRVVGRYFELQGEAEIFTAVQDLKEYLLEYGGVEALKAAHRGALALGWDACRAKPHCDVCPLRTCCRSAAKFLFDRIGA